MPYLLPLPTPDAFWHDNLYWLRTTPGAGAGAGEDAIAQWEARTGFGLPGALRALYAQRNGGVSDWLNAVVGVEGPVSLRATFGSRWSRLAAEGPLRGVTLGEVSDGIDFGEEDGSYRHALGGDTDRMWVVANYGSSRYLMLDYRHDAQQPAVTLFDDDSRFYGDAVVKSDGLYVLARTFDDFLGNCRREIAHPLRVWSVDGADAAALGQRLGARLNAAPQPVGRMAMDGWHHQYGQDHLRLPDPYLAEEYQPDFGKILQYSGGLLGDATLRVYRNLSLQGTRAERFAGNGAVLVSLLVPTSGPTPLPPDASDAIEAALDDDEAGLAWTRWLDTGTADFMAEDDMLSPAIDHPHPEVKSLQAEAGRR